MVLKKKGLPHLVCREIALIAMQLNWSEEIEQRFANSIDLDAIKWSHCARAMTLRNLHADMIELGFEEMMDRYGDRHAHPTGAMLLETRVRQTSPGKNLHQRPVSRQ